MNTINNNNNNNNNNNENENMNMNMNMNMNRRRRRRESDPSPEPGFEDTFLRKNNNKKFVKFNLGSISNRIESSINVTS